jgi:hypothetical protein
LKRLNRRTRSLAGKNQPIIKAEHSRMMTRDFYGNADSKTGLDKIVV